MVINSPYNVKIEEVDIPKVKSGEILVKAKVSGISSGTEMMLYRGTYPNFKHKKWEDDWKEYPVYPGYELVGVVDKIGKEENTESSLAQVDGDRFKKGDRVVCLGPHAEYVGIPVKFAVKIPDHITDENATLVVLGTTAFHCIQRAEIEYGEVVSIIGMGVLGILALQHAKLAGASKVIAIDLDNVRLQIAKEAGADLCLNPKNCDLIKTIFEKTKIGSDVVIEASGGRGTPQVAIDIMRDRGRVVLLGWHTEDVSFSFGDLYFKEGKLITSRAIGPDQELPYSYIRFTSSINLKIVMELISQGKIKTNIFQPTIFNYNDILRAYELIDKNPKKIGLQAIINWEEKI